jgi:hypothetical protein
MGGRRHGLPGWPTRGAQRPRAAPSARPQSLAAQAQRKPACGQPRGAPAAVGGARRARGRRRRSRAGGRRGVPGASEARLFASEARARWNVTKMPWRRAGRARAADEASWWRGARISGMRAGPTLGGGSAGRRKERGSRRDDRLRLMIVLKAARPVIAVAREAAGMPGQTLPDHLLLQAEYSPWQHAVSLAPGTPRRPPARERLRRPLARRAPPTAAGAPRGWPQRTLVCVEQESAAAQMARLGSRVDAYATQQPDPAPLQGAPPRKASQIAPRLPAALASLARSIVCSLPLARRLSLAPPVTFSHVTACVAPPRHNAGTSPTQPRCMPMASHPIGPATARSLKVTTGILKGGR